MNAMTTITFDTLDIAERLEKAGATPEYAKAEAMILRDMLSSTLETNFATHDDIIRIERRIDGLEAKFEAKLDKHSWMMGVIIAMLSAILIKQFF